MNKQRLLIAALAVLLPSLAASTLAAQGVTTGTISARVNDANGNPRAGVRVIAVHTPSGTVYQARTRENGRANPPRNEGRWAIHGHRFVHRPREQVGTKRVGDARSDVRSPVHDARDRRPDPGSDGHRRARRRQDSEFFQDGRCDHRQQRGAGDASYDFR